MPDHSSSNAQQGTNLKLTVREALAKNDLDAVVAIGHDRKVMSVLIRLAYDKETLAGWRAISAVGRVASLYAADDPAFLRETARKLLWSLTDESGGIGWSAPELLGEIVSSDPAGLHDITPLIAEVFFVEERVFRPGVLYALRRIAEKDPGAVLGYSDIIERGLYEEEPLSRIHALALVSLLKDRFPDERKEAIRARIQELTADRGESWVYKGQDFISIEVGEFARSVLDNY